MEVKNQRILVVGLGKSGVASALFLKARGARVTVSDAKTEEELRQEIPSLLDAGIAVEAGGHGERTFRDQDLIVVSPGVPVDVPQLEQARALGVPVIGEIELASRFLSGHIVAITGSNGKTTTTALSGEVISWGGYETLVGGNIGTPAISLVADSTSDTYVVLEVSSFQLETIQSFHPFIAVVLNVSPDHLDRHRSFENYVAAKARIFENQNESDFAVLNFDDPTCRDLAKKTRAHVRWFSRKGEVESGAWAADGKIWWRDDDNDRQELMPVSSIPLKGAHNLENVLAAACCGRIVGAEPRRVASAVSEFKAVEHRLEYVATLNGVEFYNDSKATNVDATIKALESFSGGIHIILGGKDKGSDYSVLAPLLKARVRRVYTIGAAAEKIEQQIAGAAEVLRAETLENAVRRAAEAASPGEVVLLAPACASFDQFQNYEHRGRVFKEAVAALEARAKGPSAAAIPGEGGAQAHG
ncbi:MAG TPA: UDP-N-acetylmuramoyl-L-alanine--D-glutamate ligase [Terriglobales bacterium]|nr:UDP-N-acetylmuramoyl-L-alanine--D-glutamate ligase [Terriglobales bacterium]